MIWWKLLTSWLLLIFPQEEAILEIEWKKRTQYSLDSIVFFIIYVSLVVSLFVCDLYKRLSYGYFKLRSLFTNLLRICSPVLSTHKSITTWNISHKFHYFSLISLNYLTVAKCLVRAERDEKSIHIFCSDSCLEWERCGGEDIHK